MDVSQQVGKSIHWSNGGMPPFGLTYTYFIRERGLLGGSGGGVIVLVVDNWPVMIEVGTDVGLVVLHGPVKERDANHWEKGDHTGC